MGGFDEFQPGRFLSSRLVGGWNYWRGFVSKEVSEKTSCSFQWELEQAVTLSSSYIFLVQDSSRGGFIRILGHNIRHSGDCKVKTAWVCQTLCLSRWTKLSREPDVTELTKHGFKDGELSEGLWKGRVHAILLSAWSAAFTGVQILTWERGVEMGAITIFEFPAAQVLFHVCRGRWVDGRCWGLQVSVHPQLCISFLPASPLVLPGSFPTSACLPWVIVLFAFCWVAPSLRWLPLPAQRVPVFTAGFTPQLGRCLGTPWFSPCLYSGKAPWLLVAAQGCPVMSLAEEHAVEIDLSKPLAAHRLL